MIEKTNVYDTCIQQSSGLSCDVPEKNINILLSFQSIFKAS